MDRPEEPAGRPPPDLGERVRDVAAQFGALVREHAELARVEAVADVKKAGRDLAGIGAGAVVALLGWALLMTGAALLLGRSLGNWAGFLVVGGLHAVAGVVLMAQESARLRGPDKPGLEETARALREDRALALRLRAGGQVPRGRT